MPDLTSPVALAISTDSRGNIIYSAELIAALKTLVNGLPRVEGVKVVGKVLGKSPRRAREIYARLLDGTVESKDGSTPLSSPPSAGDVFDVSVETSKAATIEEVISLCSVDTNQWESRGFSIRRGAKGFSWNARFAKREIAIDTVLAADLKADLQAFAPEYKPVKYTPSPSEGKLLVVSIFDAHLGKLSWAEQDGENYDLKIAKTMFMRALYDLVAKAKVQGNISRILFPVGNDYLTCDGDDHETSAGTPQSVDGRFPKIFREARKLLVEAIDYLRQIAPVDVIVICGNHERESMFHLGDALECWYHADTNVTIDNQFKPRKYYSFGNTVFGLTHGDTIKQDQLPLLGANERADLWAKCKRRVWFLGHFHHLSLKEYVGVQVWILPSLSGSDNYHQSNGYVGAVRCAMAFLYGENGLETIFQSEPEN